MRSKISFDFSNTSDKLELESTVINIMEYYCLMDLTSNSDSPPFSKIERELKAKTSAGLQKLIKVEKVGYKTYRAQIFLPYVYDGVLANKDAEISCLYRQIRGLNSRIDNFNKLSWLKRIWLVFLRKGI